MLTCPVLSGHLHFLSIEDLTTKQGDSGDRVVFFN